MSSQMRVFSGLALFLGVFVASSALAVPVAPGKSAKGKTIAYSAPSTSASIVASPLIVNPIPAPSSGPAAAPAAPPVDAPVGGGGGGGGGGVAITPEPGTFALLGLGLAAFARRRRRV
jgi:hypothetical protein